MTDFDPEYTKNTRGYKNRVATRCRVCGGQLLMAEEIKIEMHEHCAMKEDTNTYLM